MSLHMGLRGHLRGCPGPAWPKSTATFLRKPPAAGEGLSPSDRSTQSAKGTLTALCRPDSGTQTGNEMPPPTAKSERASSSQNESAQASDPEPPSPWSPAPSMGKTLGTGTEGLTRPAAAGPEAPLSLSSLRGAVVSFLPESLSPFLTSPNKLRPAPLKSWHDRRHVWP